MLRAPLRVSYIALFSDWSNREAERQKVGELARQFGAEAPEPDATHFSNDLGLFRLKWERHTEFARYKVIVAGGAAEALTDARIQSDGFTPLLVDDRGMSPRQAGRMVQRLLEIETYRVMALLALPVARGLTLVLTDHERELARLTAALAEAGEADEPVLLEGLTRLDAELERQASGNHSRFSAAAAYYELVQQRIAELRESRIQGLQTFQEFNERRLTPAMSTCRAAAARQAALSQRIARATQLLSTRVDISLERQNQAVLASMDRRAKLQLRLQETVEGLSVAALTYYVAGLVGYAAKGVSAAGYALNPDLVVGISIPVVAIIVALGVRRLRKVVIRTGS